MAVQWGGYAGHMRVGIDVFTDGYDTNTPSINVYVDVYINIDSTWNFNDAQRIDLSGSVGGAWNFQNNLGKNGTQYIGRAIIYNQGQNYGGGPYYSFRAVLSGHYQGATPSVDVGFNLPARPANVPAPPGIGIDSVTSTGARILVYAPDPRGAGIDAYQTVTSKPGADFSSWTNDFGGGTGTVNNLQPASTYQAATRAHNAVGWSDWAYSGQFTTGATVPGQVGGFSIDQVAQTSARANWTAPGNGGSAIGYYELQLSDNSGFTAGLRTIQISQGSPWTQSDLTPGKLYYARMRAVNGVGAGSYSTAVSFTTLAGTPTIITPANNGTVPDAVATFLVEALGITSNSRITVEYSQVNDFSSGVQTLILNPTGPTANNRYTVADSTKYLKTGVWYARAKVTNLSSGYVTPYSSVNTFTEAHAPSASVVSPTAGEYVKYAASPIFTWKFNDAAGNNDNQTAYQLVIENNSTGAVIYDSGKTVMATTPGQQNVSVSVPLASTYKNVGLRWKVLVYDKGDTASPFTGYALFTLADTPVVTVTAPSSATPVDNGAPTFAWTVGIPSGGSQERAVVAVYKTSDNSKVWEGTVTGSATSITPPIVILENAASYYFTLTVTDTNKLVTSVTSSFTTSYNAPAPVRYVASNDQMDVNGYNLISWTDANPDEQFAMWKVYRREGAGPWSLLAKISDQNTRSYADYMLVAGNQYSYSVTQIATRSGVLLESPVGYYLDANGTQLPEARALVADLQSYWIINPDDPSLSVRLPSVKSDGSTLEYEQETYTIIGRGRHTDYGDRLGYTGTIECQIRQPLRRAEFRDKIEALRDAQETYFYRTPFGRLFKISLGDIAWSPLGGTGLMEMGDMSIPYNEVA